MEKIYAQHGDVILYKVNEMPVTAKFIGKAKKGYIIEKGEGVHTHTLKEGDMDVYEDNDVLYFKCNSPCEIDHEEHHIQTIQPGIVRKVIEREYDYETEEARKVVD